jgi:hypothetical protein
MRYYYTDPLAAAFMAKHHGMRFMDCAGFDVSACPRLLDCSERHGLAEAMYIHPDSLPMLHPRIGDLYYNSCNGSYHEVTKKGAPKLIEGSCEIRWQYSGRKPEDITLQTALMWWNGGDTTDRIIQRKGIAFHHPESEDE